jgi:hypothetical protein
MQMFRSALIVSFALAPLALLAQETPTTAPGQQPAAQSPEAAVPAARTASAVLQPALSQAQETLSGLKIEKWKKGSVRDEAGENVRALLHDLQTNIPPLLAAADAEPSALSHAMPLMKHLDAFYDVFLRVEEASRVSAPSEQITALQATMLSVNQARIGYDDELQTQAAAHEKLIFTLRTQLQTQTEAAAKSAEEAKTAEAKAAECKPAPKPTHHRRTTKKKAEPSTQKPQSTDKPQ